MRLTLTNPLPLSAAVTLIAALLLTAGCQKSAEKATAPVEPTPTESSAPMSTEANPAITTPDQLVSYGIAHNLGQQVIRQGGLEIDRVAFLAGLEDGLASKGPRMPEAELQAAFAEIQERAQAAAAKIAAEKSAAGNAYLAANKEKPGVTTTASGLQYEVLRAGTGAKPTPQDTVEVHYHGTLLDGTVFDSSVERGETISFPVTGVIPGWVEALQLMSVGAKWKLTIPSNLAYGDRASGKIPPGSVLIFEVELISIAQK